jgi:cell wall assembly regulator SMI1
MTPEERGMKRLFDRIHVWLAANAPEVLASLRPGATEEAIRAAEREMGVTLPDDVRAAYRIHDGQEWGHDLVYGRQWLPLADVVGTWRSLKKMIDGETVAPADKVPAKEATRADYWHPAWIPLASNESSHHLCLDLDPAPGGRVGQIIYWWHDMDSPRSVAAISFADWLEELADELEDGEWTTHPDYDGLVRVDEIFEE